MKMRVWSGVVMVLLLACAGCTATTVKRVERDDEKGLRFYRPKPYLLITPADQAGPDKVTIKIEHLPDFTEEYVVRQWAGMGINTTNVTLNDDGTLASLNVTLDSQTDENLDAIANVIKAIPTDGPAGPGESRAKSEIVVSAHRVPFGLYEAVVSRGPDCRKRLYGWRYVGFAPYTGCPMESGGLPTTDCCETLYGLVSINNTMVFAALPDIATEVVQPQAPSAAPADCRPSQLLGAVNGRLTTEGGPKIAAANFEVDFDKSMNSLTVTVKNVADADRERVCSAVRACAPIVYDSDPEVSVN